MLSQLKVGTTAWLWDDLATADTLCAQAQMAESLGFDSFWVPEHHFATRHAIPAPLMLLAAVAARTQAIRLGSTSYLLPIRHPLLAAEEVAVLDQLCGGRLILGIGRGMSAAMFKAFGVDTANKRQLFQSHLKVMCAAWRGEAITTDDSNAPVYLSPLPLQRPHPPLWVAAFGPLALRQVGTLGLPYLASPLESLAVLEANYRVYHEAVQAAGKAMVQTVPVMRTVFVTSSKSEAAQVRAALANAVPVSARHQPGVLDEWAIVGDCHYTADRLQEYAGRLGLTHLIVRGGIAGVTNAAQMRSHEQLLGLTT